MRNKLFSLTLILSQLLGGCTPASNSSIDKWSQTSFGGYFKLNATSSEIALPANDQEFINYMKSNGGEISEGSLSESRDVYSPQIQKNCGSIDMTIVFDFQLHYPGWGKEPFKPRYRALIKDKKVICVEEKFSFIPIF